MMLASLPTGIPGVQEQYEFGGVVVDPHNH